MNDIIGELDSMYSLQSPEIPKSNKVYPKHDSI